MKVLKDKRVRTVNLALFVGVIVAGVAAGFMGQGALSAALLAFAGGQLGPSVLDRSSAE